ncbi:hypothetical protein NQZ68_017791 [Dissostichus eleginoides]|nr:hypothetical protein NQZ68_017791 [Dissostichus eleginoides]
MKPPWKLQARRREEGGKVVKGVEAEKGCNEAARQTHEGAVIVGGGSSEEGWTEEDDATEKERRKEGGVEEKKGKVVRKKDQSAEIKSKEEMQRDKKDVEGERQSVSVCSSGITAIERLKS